MVNRNNIAIFLVGLCQFFNYFFITKYVEYIYLAHVTMLVFTSLQAVSLIGLVIYRPAKWVLEWALLAALIGLLLLSYSRLGVHFFWPILGIFFVVTSFNVLLVHVFTEPGIKINSVYFIEIAGGILGVIIFQLLAAKIGFKGFAILNLSCLAAFYLLKGTSKAKYYFPILALGTSFLVTEPAPILEKRDRAKMVENGKILFQAWEPNGHIEVIESAPRSMYFSIAGGLYRSHIPVVTESIEELKKLYVASDPKHLWGLDVAAPHYITGRDRKRVALVSCLGGQEILPAKAFGATEIYCIDINSTGLKESASGRFVPDDAKRIFENVKVVELDGRRFLEGNPPESFDVIQIYSAATGAYTSNLGNIYTPSSLITAEAIQTYKRLLKHNGVLHITLSPLKRVSLTFEAALGEKEFAEKVFIFKRSDKEDNLVSFLYRPSGWDPSISNYLRAWLNADQTRRWDIVKDPNANNLESLNEFYKFTDPESEIKKASTDDWPFTRIREIGYFQNEQIRIFIYVLIFCAALFLVILFYFFKSKKSISGASLSLLSGLTFSATQSYLIFWTQKTIGLPASGISFTTIGMAAIVCLGILLSQMKFSKLYFPILALVMLVVSLLTNDKVLLFSLPIVLLSQSLYYPKVLEENQIEFKWIYICNSAGAIIGLLAYSLTFVSSGQQAASQFMICALITMQVGWLANTYLASKR